MRIFGDIFTSMLAGLAFLGILALANKWITIDPSLDRIGVILALVYLVAGSVSLLIWRGFHQPSANTIWARIARAMRENW